MQHFPVATTLNLLSPKMHATFNNGLIEHNRNSKFVTGLNLLLLQKKTWEKRILGHCGFSDIFTDFIKKFWSKYLIMSDLHVTLTEVSHK